MTEDVSKSSQAVKASIIVVHGNALDKIGFHIAEKANRSAELRLEKTLQTLNMMEMKGQSKFRKERISVQENLNRLRNEQLQMRRRQMKKSLSSRAVSISMKVPECGGQYNDDIENDRSGDNNNEHSGSGHRFHQAWRGPKEEKIQEGKDPVKACGKSHPNGKSFKELQNESVKMKALEAPCATPEIKTIKQHNRKNNTTLEKQTRALPHPLLRGFTQPELYSNRSSMAETCRGRTSAESKPADFQASDFGLLVLPDCPHFGKSMCTERTKSAKFPTRILDASGVERESSQRTYMSLIPEPPPDGDSSEDWTDVMPHEHVVCLRQGPIASDWLPPEKEELLQRMEEERHKLQQRVDKFLAEITSPNKK